MNEERLEQLLMEALDLLERGIAVEDILARYPREAGELRPYLATAVQLPQLLGTASALPAPQAQARSKQSFLAAADTLVAAARSAPLRTASPWMWMRRLLAPTLALLVIVFLAGATIVTAAGSALPGDTLYGTKLFVEGVRLSQAANPEALQEQFRQERIREVQRLQDSGRGAQVTIAGEIQAMEDGRLVVGGLVVSLTVDTIVEGEPLVGREVEVEGYTTEASMLFAERIVVDQQSGPIIPTAPPFPTATLIPPTVTTQPSPTNTSVPTAVPPTAPPPTQAPLPSPTADDNDDNGNDNDNDNDNDDGGDDDDGNANDDDDDNSGRGDDNNNDNDDDDDTNSGSGNGDDDDGGD